MAKQTKTRNARRTPTPYAKSTQMSLRTQRIIYVAIAAVVILTMVVAAAASLFGGGGAFTPS